jgi:hypothetical protein
VSDNGGMGEFQNKFPASASSNFPLRGCKSSLFEGGVRALSFISGGFLPAAARGQTRPQLLHVVDIWTTLVSAAQIPYVGQGVDGLDAWDVISSAAPSSAVTAVRSELPVSIDSNPLSLAGNIPHRPEPGDGNANYTALIQWPYKLIVGMYANPALGRDPALRRLFAGTWTIENYTNIPPSASVIGDSPDFLLYDLEKDEEETTNLALQMPAVVENLTSRIQNFWLSDKTFVRSQVNLPRREANPKYFNWTWAPFMNA